LSARMLRLTRKAEVVSVRWSRYCTRSSWVTRRSGSSGRQPGSRGRPTRTSSWCSDAWSARHLLATEWSERQNPCPLHRDRAVAMSVEFPYLRTICRGGGRADAVVLGSAQWTHIRVTESEEIVAVRCTALDFARL
jgi:hypothetical protein